MSERSTVQEIRDILKEMSKGQTQEGGVANEMRMYGESDLENIDDELKKN